jgi:hypothetical protein
VEDDGRLVNRRLSPFTLGIRYRLVGKHIRKCAGEGAVLFVLAWERELDALLLRYPCLCLCNRLQLDT